MIIIGKNPILETLRANPKDLTKIIFMKNMKPEPRMKEILGLANANGISIISLHKNDFEKYFSSKDKKEGISQGMIGFMKDFEYIPLKELLHKVEAVDNPLLIILDEITDPHNFGAIIRSAVCFGADGIIIPRHNSAEVNHTVIKTSSGAVNYIPIAMETNMNNVIKMLKQNAFTIIGTDAQATTTTFNSNFKKAICLIVGSEGSGIRMSLSNNCDELVKIPMSGGFNSLNASVSTAVFLYEIMRQKKN